MWLRTSSLVLLAAGVPVLSCSGAVRPPAAGVCTTNAIEAPVSLAVPTGTLHGTLLTPPGCGPTPVALFIAGSGPTDRDGNGRAGVALQTDSYAQLAHALAKRGIASLRYDKRGVAESVDAATSESELRFEQCADDAALWLAQLKRDPRFSKKIVLGHSEGSLLGVLAAQKEPVGAFISIAGPGRPAGQVLREQLERQLSGDRFEQANAVLRSLEQGREVDHVPAQLSQVFRPSVQPYLVSWLKYDPAKELGKLAIPTLIVQGTTDQQVGVADAKRLAQARPDAKLLVIDGMAHVLKDAARGDQREAYTDPSLPLSASLVDGIVAFLDTALKP